MAAPYTEKFAYETVGGVKRLLYKGEAEPGTSEGSSSWRICKFEYDADHDVVLIGWAGGSNAFAYVWNNRASYSYS